MQQQPSYILKPAVEVVFDPYNIEHLKAAKVLIEGGKQPPIKFTLRHPFKMVRDMLLYDISMSCIDQREGEVNGSNQESTYQHYTGLPPVVVHINSPRGTTAS